jgi:ferredoxin
LRDGAIVYSRIETESDLPIGWGDEQDAGYYRLNDRGDAEIFGYTVGPDSWKRYLNPPKHVLWKATRKNNKMHIEVDDSAPKYAFFGVRACELAAIQTLDRVFVDDKYKDFSYESVRESTLLIAVNCSTPSKTCFCTSTETGPKVSLGFDLALTELLDRKSHRFLIEAGSAAGRKILSDMPTHPAGSTDLGSAEKVTQKCVASISRRLDRDGLPELLADNPQHPRWRAVSERCLSCGNCTQVCPTCFCTSIEDHTNLAGDQTERVKVWDSCFTSQFAELSGGQVRQSIEARYRQWMTHKLSSWVDQFGTSGCIGCGRCIAWCPVGIDITEEADFIRKDVEAAQ